MIGFIARIEYDRVFWGWNERIKSYLEQMENPYHYVDNGTAVRLRFADTSESLTDRLILAAQAIEM